MTLIEFTRDIYKIEDRVQRICQDPVKMVMENDDLPCDGVRCIDGEMQKVIEVSSDVYIPVLELISYTKEDIEASNDEDLKAVWEAYMGNVKIEYLTFEGIMAAARDYYARKHKCEEMLAKCTN